MNSRPAQSRAGRGGWKWPIRRLIRRLREDERVPWLVALPLIIGVSAALWAVIILSLSYVL